MKKYRYSPADQRRGNFIITYDNVTGKWYTKDKSSKYVTLMSHSTYDVALTYVNTQEKIK